MILFWVLSDSYSKKLSTCSVQRLLSANQLMLVQNKRYCHCMVELQRGRSFGKLFDGQWLMLQKCKAFPHVPSLSPRGPTLTLKDCTNVQSKMRIV